MKELKVAVIGANGRMGQEIAKALEANPRTSAFAGVVRKGRAEGFQYSETGAESKRAKEADVWIDFSSLESFSDVLRSAAKLKKPLVSGVTGISAAHAKELSSAAKATALLWSPNMSFGIAALKKALAVAAELDGFDFQIEEIHHKHKKDKPSGTAIYLQKELVSQVGSKKVPEPLAVRGGGVFGVHKVWMMSDEEVLTFEHQALNRAVFAKGAVRAAIWLVDRPKGLYTMDDLFAGAK